MNYNLKVFINAEALSEGVIIVSPFTIIDDGSYVNIDDYIFKVEKSMDCDNGYIGLTRFQYELLDANLGDEIFLETLNEFEQPQSVHICFGLLTYYNENNKKKSKRIRVEDILPTIIKELTGKVFNDGQRQIIMFEGITYILKLSNLVTRNLSPLDYGLINENLILTMGNIKGINFKRPHLTRHMDW